MTTKKTTVGLIWHQRDLRLEQNKAVSSAVSENSATFALYIYDEELEVLGAASKWWLHHSLLALEKEYEKRGCVLIIRQGKTLPILLEMVVEGGVKKVYWNKRFEPKCVLMQQKAEQALNKIGVEVAIFNENFLIDPKEVLVGGKHPYAVFTPFYKAALKHLEDSKCPRLPKSLLSVKEVNTESLESLKLIPPHPWVKKLARHWRPGRQEGLKLLKAFIKKGLTFYKENRDLLKQNSTSLLSPYLHWGELSIQEVYDSTKKSSAFSKQLFWREFGNYLLFHFPSIETENWNQKFNHFQWENKSALLKKWKQGKTGYPIVDAGMRQLWETGWMHNRVRMIVASFLTKDLLTIWQKGEAWFWDTLVDADKGNNVLGWQWVAGCGPDPAPFFRIFNPVFQGEKYDPEGTYVRSYIPELKKMPKEWIHRPWEAPEEILKKAGVILGKTYPRPVIRHEMARLEALKRYNTTCKK